MSGFAASELADVLMKLQAAGWDAVLVGGQAVNIWAMQFPSDESEWSEFRPFTSLDLDYYGGPFEARLAMQCLGASGRINRGDDPSPNAGVVETQLADGRALLIDVLTGVFGVSSAELERTAIRLTGAGPLAELTLRVMHPLLLMESKAACLRGLSQTSRQDSKHLRMMIVATRNWLHSQQSHPRRIFRAIERIAAFAQSPDGLHAFAKGIDVMQAVPISDLEKDANFSEFFAERLPRLTAILVGKRQRHLQLVSQS